MKRKYPSNSNLVGPAKEIFEDDQAHFDRCFSGRFGRRCGLLWRVSNPETSRDNRYSRPNSAKLETFIAFTKKMLECIFFRKSLFNLNYDPFPMKNNKLTTIIFLSFIMAISVAASTAQGDESVEKIFSKGMENLKLGWYKDAAREFNKVLELNPEHIDARFHMGEIYQAQERYEDSVAELKKAISLRPGFTEAHYNLGKTYKKLERYEEAAAEFEKALAIDSEHPKSKASLNVANKLLAVEKNPDDPKERLALGDALAELRRNREAVPVYREAIRLNPLSPQAHFSLAMALKRTRRFQDAIDEFKKTLLIDPENIDAHHFLGKAYRAVGMHRESLREFKQVIEFDPENSLAHFTLGFAYKELARYHDAVKELEEAVRLDPKDPQARFHLGDVYLKVGRKKEHVEQLQKALDLFD